MSRRREFFSRLAQIGTGLFVGGKAVAQEHQHAGHDMAGVRGMTTGSSKEPNASGQPAGIEQGVARGLRQPPSEAPQKKKAFNVPVEFPDLPKLPFKMVDGWKEFNLIAEPVRTEFVAGRVVDAWGYNGSVPGPTIEVNQGDKVRVVFDNHLPEPTAVHWHGFEVPMEMDGSVGLGQDPVSPGGRFVYEFELHQAGTFFYHSHMAMQEMAGMMGFFIMHPKEPYEPHCDRDFGIVLQEWALLPNNTVPNTLAMEFNWLTFNGKSGPATTPMLVKQGERVRIRIINIGMDHHPIHLHGNQFVVTGTEGGRGPVHGWVNENTVLVGVAQARDIEFDAKYVGDWMLHCHLPHHMMNQMMSMVGPIGHGGMGMHTGGGMQEGMGVVRQGNALSEELGPSLGRGLGTGSDAERLTSNSVSNDARNMMATMPGMAGMQGHAMPGGQSSTGSAFTCPMHREVRQNTPGKCPKCGMALIPESSLSAAASTAPSTSQTASHQGSDMQGHNMQGHNMSAGTVDPVTDMYPKDDPEKKKIPGYPQDMWMPMDEMFQKPENYGLRRGWSGAMGGMMTLVRVLPAEKYEHIMMLVQQQKGQGSAESRKPAHVLRGKVEAVSETSGKLTVNHGAVEGWMGAMTMAYPVDKPETLKKVKVADEIKATVYEGDLTLHDVEVVSSSQPKK